MTIDSLLFLLEYLSKTMVVDEVVIAPELGTHLIWMGVTVAPLSTVFHLSTILLLL